MLKLSLNSLCIQISIILFLSFSASPTTFASKPNDHDKYNVEIILDNLNRPWALVAAPEGGLLILEKKGTITSFKSGKRSMFFSGLPQVVSYGQGGLMDLAFHPDFKKNKLIYLTYTAGPRGKLRTRVSRFKLSANALTEQKDIIDGGIGYDGAHFGSRLAFGSDGKLYVSLGERHNKKLAQDLTKLHGKIIRLNDDGSIPSDNPFVSHPNANHAIYSYGHRNPQGMAFHPTTGELYITEHGPSGYDAPGGGDEINLVMPGKNYGWPLIHHDLKEAGNESPLKQWTPAIAPSGASFYTSDKFPAWKNHFFFTSLRGETLFRIQFSSENSKKIIELSELLKAKFGRLRDVASPQDGLIYIATDGGKLVRISPK